MRLPGWTWPLGIALICLGVRLPGLMDMPIFCDEAVYLRYAQLIHRAPLSNAFSSLVDPKPPLHYWLLAVLFGASSDPLLPARLLSVAAGLISVLVVIPLCRELGALRRQPPTPSVGGRLDSFTVAACLLFLTCPFLAFYQRMALAESLLVLEILLVAWLGLRVARLAAEGSSPLPSGLALGLAMGSALLTKQNHSYTAMALPILAAALRWKDLQSQQRRSLSRVLALAFGIALLLFSPIFFVDRGPDLRDRLFFRATHGEFGGGVAWHARLLWDNFRYTFVPMVIDRTGPGTLYEGFHPPADAGWLWIYLTPPVYLASLAGFLVLAWRRELRLLTYVGIWSVLMLLPFLPFATTAVSRYAVAVAPPFLLAAAGLIGLASNGAGFAASKRRWIWAALLAGALVWPLHSIWLQDARWKNQPFTRSDRWQYVSGWPAGSASRLAVDSIAERARHGPLVVVTSHLSGTPNDVVWSSLEGRHGVRLCFVPWAFRKPILRPSTPPDTFLLHSGFHEAVVSENRVTIGQDVPILFVGMDPYPSARAPRSADELLRLLNPGMTEIARFENPPMKGIPHRDAVVIYRLR